MVFIKEIFFLRKAFQMFLKNRKNGGLQILVKYLQNKTD